MKQCSRAIAPGSRRIALTGADDPKGLDGLAFLTADGHASVVVLANNSLIAKTITISTGAASFQATLQPESLNSFTSSF
jgi:hypothetical protein